MHARAAVRAGRGPLARRRPRARGPGVAHPRDVLALQVGHQIDFFTGRSRMLRDRIARALPRWHAGMPGYHAVLGMHGLRAGGDRRLRARRGARAPGGRARSRATAGPGTRWRTCMEMQNRRRDGVAWLGACAPHLERRQLLRRAQLVAPGAVPSRAGRASTRCWRWSTSASSAASRRSCST